MLNLFFYFGKTNQHIFAGEFKTVTQRFENIFFTVTVLKIALRKTTLKESTEQCILQVFPLHLRDNSVHVQDCSPFWVGIFIIC